MTIYILVEGDTEVHALPQLLKGLYTSRRLRRPLPLHGAKFLPRVGKAAAAILAKRLDDHVFACPDVAPNASYENTRLAYRDCAELQAVLTREVKRELGARLAPNRVNQAIERFHPHPFCHDFEVLYLASSERLSSYLGTTANITKHYNHSRPEEQNLLKYPKTIVRFLFRHFAGRNYNDVDDSRSFFAPVTEDHLAAITRRCPRFAGLVEALRKLVAT
ncbi:MAG: DUF4276 family protein [Planctomycetes bacterium]|nr:DUF4276 family protein [Planctomycetota bacterium]